MNEIQIGTVVFGNWKVIKMIGQGSCGTVYEIEREQNFGIRRKEQQKQSAALKVLHVRKNPQDVARLKGMGLGHAEIESFFQDYVHELCQEIEIMYPLKDHRNIVRHEEHAIYTRENGTGWDILIRMELLTPLSSYVVEHPLSEKQVLQVGIDICQALEACEKRNIVHRDIKPENVFVSQFHTFKLGDFGSAKITEDTATGTLTGTYAYMAPELVIRREYNVSTDIYSLGIMLYQYLNSGRLPFLPPLQEQITMTDLENAFCARLSGNPFPAIPWVYPELNAIIRKACAYRPEERYQTAAELRAALENYREKRDGNVFIDKTGEIHEGHRTGASAPDFGDDTTFIPDAVPAHNSAQLRKNKSAAAGAILCLAGALIVAGTLMHKKDKSLADEKRNVVIAEKSDDIEKTNIAVDYMTDLQILEPSTPVAPGDYVTFGAYEGDNVSGSDVKPLEWKVLDVQGDEALLLCRNGIAQKTFDEKTVRWENSDRRYWLNTEFMNEAFTIEEKQGIRRRYAWYTTTYTAGITATNRFEDQVFCISLDELEDYDSVPNLYPCEVTPFALTRGGNILLDRNQLGAWWIGDWKESNLGDNRYDTEVRPCIIVNEGTLSLITHKIAFEPGDIVRYGKYEQDNDMEDGKEEIEWVVLGPISGENILLISRYVLDCRPFDVTAWEECSLRQWLNDEFMMNAFNSLERKDIIPHILSNKDSSGIELLNGLDTYDFVFCLSQDEVERYLEEEDKKCVLDSKTERSINLISDVAKGNTISDWWWLRTRCGGYATFIDCNGTYQECDEDHDTEIGIVRPAIWVKTSALTGTCTDK